MYCSFANGAHGLANRGERRIGECHKWGVVETNHRDILGNAQMGISRGSYRAKREQIARSHNAGDSGLQKLSRTAVSTFDTEACLDDFSTQSK